MIKPTVSKKHKEHDGGKTITIPPSPRKKVVKKDNNPDDHSLVDVPCSFCGSLCITPADQKVICGRCVILSNRPKAVA